jgi:hypothetical protein
MAEKTRLELLADKLWADKGPAGQEYRKTAKELFPDINTPEDQFAVAAAPLKAELDETRAQLGKAMERITAREKADADATAENALSVKLRQAQKEFGLTDAGFEKMTARMKETGNYSDAQAAAAWVVSQTPKPAPSSSPSWLPEPSNMFGSQKKDEAFEALHKDPRKYMDDQLREFARDPEKYTAETFS